MYFASVLSIVVGFVFTSLSLNVEVLGVSTFASLFLKVV